MLDKQKIQSPLGLRALINDAYRADELSVISGFIEYAKLNENINLAIEITAKNLVKEVRINRAKTTGIDSFLTEYSLSSDEGIALMCLAEALLRVPDNKTIDSLIKDKLTKADWQAHSGQSKSFLINATTWALMLTGKILSPEKASSMFSKGLLSLVNRGSESIVRAAVEKAMRIMSKQFVMGRTIVEAIKRAKKKEAEGYRYSYDMLGEAALAAPDALRYFKAYSDAIEAIGKSHAVEEDVFTKPGISIKLSALHPCYEEDKYERVLKELSPILLGLAQLAKKYNIAFTIDAEESERLDLSLDLIERVFSAPSLNDWNGFGLAIQSYQKRAFYLLDWVADLARSNNKRMMVRLIKGAYWDSEIKKAQMDGLSDYPVFTNKVFTDISFQACAKKIMTMTDAIYPQFATHNAYSVAMILNIVGDYRDFEFQCLHGMGAELYEEIVPKAKYGIPCRIYAPVGSHNDLLPYLVRRLLENGANSSFVNRIADCNAPIEDLVFDPVARAGLLIDKINLNIPLPKDIFQPVRKNSLGIDFSDRKLRELLQKDLIKIALTKWHAEPIVANKKTTIKDKCIKVFAPFDSSKEIGDVIEASFTDVDIAISNAKNAKLTWSKTKVSERAECILRFADLLEKSMPTLLVMACLEAGKTWHDGVAEVREAIDFCRYYSSIAIDLQSKPKELRGYTGELNELSYHPRGIVLCISPWNFPLAIFTGQVIAALVTGNCVIAKPAEQTPLIAYFAVKLMLEAGIPEGVIQLLPGVGETIGAKLVASLDINAVIFTGGTKTAKIINKTLAMRGGEIVPFIAETGGQNAMIVDSSALLQQVIVDVINSAFGSAGQRCSALRVLYIQEEIYLPLIDLLKGAMLELDIGDPSLLSTDVGPVIDKDSLKSIQDHVESMCKSYELIYQCNLNAQCKNGYYMPPTAIAINNISSLKNEVFGPVLHVIKYKRKNLDEVINEINSTGYGLTLGIHSRINETVDYIRERVHVGNCYVNRNIIGAVVGLQPFGGEGLSGTGPKAGGPNYLLKLCHERTFTVDTTAAGGNASLMSLT